MIRTLAVVALASITSVGCLPSDEPPPKNAIRVGLLLPFTGDVGAGGTNIERALIMAAEKINDAGGVGGKRVHIVAEDTHSDPERGMESASRLVDQGPAVIIGTESEDLAQRILPLVERERIPLVSGNIGASKSTDDDDFVFNTAPSSTVLGAALADRMYVDGHRTIAILHVDDAYGEGFASAITNRFEELGGTVASRVDYSSGQSSYREPLRRLTTNRPDAFVLVAYPRTGAAIIREWAILGERGRWYFSPTLHSDDFLNHIPPGVLEDDVGVSAAVANDAEIFAQQFARRWGGDQPLQSTYFYYDALVMWALSYEAAIVANGAPSKARAREQMEAVSKKPGEVVTWEEVSQAMALVRAGEEVDYCGASGSLDLDSDGDVATWIIEFWAIRGDRIIAEPTRRTRTWCRLRIAQ